MHDTIGSTDDESSERTGTSKNTARHARAANADERGGNGECVRIRAQSGGRHGDHRPHQHEPRAAADRGGRRAVGRGGDARRTAPLREQRSFRLGERARRRAPHNRGHHRRRPRAARARGDTGRPPRLRRQHRRRFHQRDRHHHQHRHRRSHRRGAHALDARDRAGRAQGLRRERLGQQRHGDRSRDRMRVSPPSGSASCRWRSRSRRTAGSRSSPTPARIR